MERLGDMFNRQKVFQAMLGNDVKSQAFLNEQTLAMFVETGEMVQETNWKSWKEPRDVDMAKLREEIMDMWHFMINISLFAGMEPWDIHREFIAKNEKNARRQVEGY